MLQLVKQDVFETILCCFYLTYMQNTLPRLHNYRKLAPILFTFSLGNLQKHALQYLEIMLLKKCNESLEVFPMESGIPDTERLEKKFLTLYISKIKKNIIGDVEALSKGTLQKVYRSGCVQSNFFFQFENL